MLTDSCPPSSFYIIFKFSFILCNSLSYKKETYKQI